MISLSNFDSEIIEKKATAMLVFTSEWCRPCALQKPIAEKLATDFKDRVIIETIDVDQQEDLSEHLQVRTLPATILFANGEIVEHLHGYQAEEFLTAYLTHIIEQQQKS